MIKLEKIINLDKTLNNIYLMIENVIYDNFDNSINKELIEKIEIELNTRFLKNENIDINFLVIAFGLLETLKNILIKDNLISSKFKIILNRFIQTTQKNKFIQWNEINKTIEDSNSTKSICESSMDELNEIRITDEAINIPCDNTISLSLERPVFKNITALIFTEWMQRNKHDPYLSRIEKNIFNKITGLNNHQTSNWFVNARRRILPKFLKKRNN